MSFFWQIYFVGGMGVVLLILFDFRNEIGEVSEFIEYLAPGTFKNARELMPRMVEFLVLVICIVVMMAGWPFFLYDIWRKR